MPKFPDILLNNNPDAPSVDLNDLQVKGVGIFADAAARDALNSNLHTEGYLAIMKDTDTVFVYTGGTWTDAANWQEAKGVWEEVAGTSTNIKYENGTVGITNSAGIAEYTTGTHSQINVIKNDLGSPFPGTNEETLLHLHNGNLAISKTSVVSSTPQSFITLKNGHHSATSGGYIGLDSYDMTLGGSSSTKIAKYDLNGNIVSYRLTISSDSAPYVGGSHPLFDANGLWFPGGILGNPDMKITMGGGDSGLQFYTHTNSSFYFMGLGVEGSNDTSGIYLGALRSGKVAYIRSSDSNTAGSYGYVGINVNTPTPTGPAFEVSSSYGKFNNGLHIGDITTTGYAFPTATGTEGQILKVDANGDLVFGDDLNGVWTADTNGITYTAGNVGIGTASSATRKLVVTGGVRLETFMEMDANNDGNGNIVIGTSSNYSALTSNNCIVIGNNNTIGASNPTQTIVIGRNKDVSSRSYRCTDIGGSGGSTYIDGSGTTSNQVAISADAGSHGAVIVIDGQVNSDYAIAIGGRAGAESVTVGNSSYASHYANYSAVVGRQIARFHTGGDSNVLVGYRVAYGTSGSSVSSSVLIGAQVANSSTTNINNVMVGYRAGYNTTTGSSNVFLGYQAGYSETTSNKLYIANSSTTSPLIYGEFDNDLCRVNGNLQRVIYGSTETTTSGTIHIRDNTDWATQADATDNTASTGLLGIALGSAANAGLVLFGDVDYTITGNVGIPVYLDTTAGGLTTTAPTGSGNIVRVMGYIIGTNKVFFNPSNDWLEIV